MLARTVTGLYKQTPKLINESIKSLSAGAEFKCVMLEHTLRLGSCRLLRPAPMYTPRLAASTGCLTCHMTMER